MCSDMFVSEAQRLQNILFLLIGLGARHKRGSQSLVNNSLAMWITTRQRKERIKEMLWGQVTALPLHNPLWGSAVTAVHMPKLKGTHIASNIPAVSQRKRGGL